ncbi:MAG: AI-2E family transporter, partial [Beijerinckiaceae bacterium]
MNNISPSRPALVIHRQWIVWAVLLALFVLALYSLRGVLLPFVAAFALAYLLDPLARRLERLGSGRLVATIFIIGLFIIIFAILLLTVLPLLANQFAALIERLPDYATRLQALLSREFGQLMQRYGASLEKLGFGTGRADFQNWASDLAAQGGSWALGLFRSILTGTQAIVGLASLLVVTPVVAFYLLADWDRMIDAIDDLLPRSNLATLRQIGREINAAIAAYIRGQGMLCLFLALWYGIGLAMVGLNFGLLIGLMSGVLSFIPYVGSILGLIVSVSIAFVQFWPDWVPILMVLGVFATGQFLEGNFLSPKLVGDAVGLHPVWVMFALFAFGSLFGFVGLLLAVPLAAAIGVVTRHALKAYRQSALYDNAAVPVPAPVPDKAL